MPCNPRSVNLAFLPVPREQLFTAWSQDVEKHRCSSSRPMRPKLSTSRCPLPLSILWMWSRGCSSACKMRACMACTGTPSSGCRAHPGRTLAGAKHRQPTGLAGARCGSAHSTARSFRAAKAPAEPSTCRPAYCAAAAFTQSRRGYGLMAVCQGSRSSHASAPPQPRSNGAPQAALHRYRA